ncbi:tRNA (5-methylaminomethyl-2-thiouridine)(34)-methyltransferase MnmD [Frischella sp. Ac48]|uniref:tRNA (5-methylaminomethyl-2-thiouridine)(34)-methyltransferase MnmD n=1 Tax=Frischella sp. Ac48 TaxID=2804531 RepID=UPI001C7CA4DB|nr:tRNA (5-methylaminomethyl-2-thiouridine)(34)-methyltransferase MnmD [Frischella sp. Ac48]MBX4133022.1 tRNA (5-methylaminomethyl-2-thiouridine)(34)-methyltransferase MnmD [Frischella sp. Ac48]
MNNQNIFWNINNTPVSIQFNDIYFNNDNAIAETDYVFIKGNQLMQRFIEFDQPIFTVAETGFGSGLNFLVLWQQFLQFKQHYPNHILKQIHFYSIEKYPLSLLDMRKIHQQIICDNTLNILAGKLQQFWPTPIHQFDTIKLHLLFDDIDQYAHFLNKHNVLIDAWFFDGFSPNKNPAMWSESLFKQLFPLTQLGGTFATFTASGQVRRNLINAGFTIKKIKGYGKKREMLIGLREF